MTSARSLHSYPSEFFDIVRVALDSGVPFVVKFPSEPYTSEKGKKSDRGKDKAIRMAFLFYDWHRALLAQGMKEEFARAKQITTTKTLVDGKWALTFVRRSDSELFGPLRKAVSQHLAKEQQRLPISSKDEDEENLLAKLGYTGED